MLRFRNIKWLPLLMAVTMVGITAFQVYWLMKTYERERRTLEIRSNITFRETIFSLQASKLKLDTLSLDSNQIKEIRFTSSAPKNRNMEVHKLPRQKMSGLVNVLIHKAKLSDKDVIITKGRNSDTLRIGMGNHSWRRKRFTQFLYDVDSLQDSIKIEEIDTAFARRMNEQNINVPFSIKKIRNNLDEEPNHNEVTLGFAHPITYQLDLGNTFPYLIKRISAVILLSLFLIALTTFSFTLLYRNLLKERRLANIKNEFISNITHELKTPIATVSVAIEALRSFNAAVDAQKTKEYLDISANELQRLSLLVDKVLKLSIFEKQGLELKYESLDMKDLVNEVTSSMRLQFERHKAVVTQNSEGDTRLQGDRLHLVSVLFNLLDNALKYSSSNPRIHIQTTGNDNKVSLCISDSGIGIPAEYRDKVFEKFFRVPKGNLHNAKGYGLGLSYVAQVIKKHNGTIKVESTEGDGSKFIISLPKHDV